MEKEKIVTEFFKRGHLLTDEAIRTLEEEGLEKYLDKPLPLVVETKDLQQQYRIIKNITHAKEQMTTEDFASFYKSKYEKMGRIITERVKKDFVSLNKIDSTRDEIHVLGMVKEIKEKDGKKIVDLEDMTTTVPVIFENADIDQDLELDDVVAIRAIAAGRVLYGKKIIYPDIPLRQPAKGTGRGCFVSDLRLNEGPQHDAERFFEWLSQTDVQYLFVAGEIGDAELFEKYVERYCYLKTVFVSYPHKFTSSRIVQLSSPAMIEVGGLNVLIAAQANNASSMRRFVLTLKKRHMGLGAISGEDQMVLEEVPDIMHTASSDEPYITNYKSVTLVNSGSLLGNFRPIVVDFATRDTEKIALQK